jgi:hypothetical protein
VFIASGDGCANGPILTSNKSPTAAALNAVTTVADFCHPEGASYPERRGLVAAKIVNDGLYRGNGFSMTRSAAWCSRSAARGNAV